MNLDSETIGKAALLAMPAWVGLVELSKRPALFGLAIMLAMAAGGAWWFLWR